MINPRNKKIAGLLLSLIICSCLGFFIGRTTEKIKYRNLLKPQKPEFAMTLGANIFYDSIHEYMDKEANKIEVEKREKISGSKTDARQILMKRMGVPASCIPSIPVQRAHNNSARIISKRKIYETQDVKIEYLEFEVCMSQFRLAGLLGYKKKSLPTSPLVVAVHGTAGSPEFLFGLEKPSDYKLKDYHKELGSKLVQDGFTVFAPYIITQLKRHKVFKSNEFRDKVDRRIMSSGLRLIGLEIGAISSALNALRNHLNIPSANTGTYGISLGGQVALYLSAIDKTIDVVVVSQFFQNFVHKWIGRKHQYAKHAYWKFPHGIWANNFGFLPEFDHERFAWLIAPRPFFLEAGAQDQPRSGSAEAAVKEISKFWRDDPEKLSFGLEQGGHEIFYSGTRRFLIRWLMNSSHNRMTQKNNFN